jgi:hypothetical protein
MTSNNSANVIIEPPYPFIDESVMTNFDHSIDKCLEARLKTEEIAMQYSGWNFCGIVWWDRAAEQFRCLVMCYHVNRETVTRPTLEEIMEYVCDHYGDD